MPRKKESSEPPPNNGNQVMTVSLFIILLAFFIMLNAMAVVDEEKKLKAIGSLLGTFRILPGGLSVFKGDAGTGVEQPTAPVTDRDHTVEMLVSPPNQDTFEDISDKVTVESDDNRNVVRIQDQVLFVDTGVTIRKSAFPFLDRLCRIINREKSAVEIAGHTDNAFGRNEDDRWRHSGLQAVAVARYLIEKGNVDPKDITAYGCGEYQPYIENVSRETKRKNRRIEITISPNARRHITRYYEKKTGRFFTFKKFVFDLPD